MSRDTLLKYAAVFFLLIAIVLAVWSTMNAFNKPTVQPRGWIDGG